MVLRELIPVLSPQIRISVRVLDEQDDDVTVVCTGKIESIPRRIFSAFADFKVKEITPPSEDFGYIDENSHELNLDSDGGVKAELDKTGKIIFTFNNTLAIYIEKYQ